MNRTKYLKGHCTQCDGHLEFPAEHIGLEVPCPHCGHSTELLLAPPPEESSLPQKAIIWTAVTILILVLGLGATLVALKRAQKLVAHQHLQASPPPRVAKEEPVAIAGFEISPIRIESSEGSSLVHAVGTVVNQTDRQRFGVRVEIELLDDSGQSLGVAKDYQQLIEPRGRWQFKGLVVGARPQSARLASIKEDQ